MVARRAGQTMKQGHERIVKALCSGDATAARRALLEELTDTREVVLDQVIQEQGQSWRLGWQRE
jgi:DNA-binding GntR family transcriptional regulator